MLLHQQAGEEEKAHHAYLSPENRAFIALPAGAVVLPGLPADVDIGNPASFLVTAFAQAATDGQHVAIKWFLDRPDGANLIERRQLWPLSSDPAEDSTASLRARLAPIAEAMITDALIVVADLNPFSVSSRRAARTSSA